MTASGALPRVVVHWMLQRKMRARRERRCPLQCRRGGSLCHQRVTATTTTTTMTTTTTAVVVERYVRSKSIGAGAECAQKACNRPTRERVAPVCT